MAKASKVFKYQRKASPKLTYKEKSQAVLTFLAGVTLAYVGVVAFGMLLAAFAPVP